MKKFLFAIILILAAALCSVCSAAQKNGKETFVDAGILRYLGTTEEEFQQGLDDLRKAVTPLIPAEGNEGNNDEFAEYDTLESFVLSLVRTRRVIHFYDSLLSMQMALRSQRINEIMLPEAVGLYLIANNPNFDILFSLNMMPSTISFGFKHGNVALQKEFNTAINAMKKDGTLARLQKKYITELVGEPEQVSFQSFKDAPTIKVAVTGDLPPIDYIAADGRPTGYNTAMLYEIGKRLKKNIRLISVDAGGRSAALASGRADVVFWYRNTEGLKTPPKLKNKNLKSVMKDNISEIILSEPYYEWDVDLIIGRN